MPHASWCLLILIRTSLSGGVGYYFGKVATNGSINNYIEFYYIMKFPFKRSNFSTVNMILFIFVIL